MQSLEIVFGTIKSVWTHRRGPEHKLPLYAHTNISIIQLVLSHSQVFNICWDKLPGVLVPRALQLEAMN